MRTPLLLLTATLLWLGTTCHSQQVIPLYEGKAPGSENWTWSEQEYSNNSFKTRVVYNVVKPTLTVYLPKPELATGTAVVVAPGGAFHILSIDNEGIEVAKWLNSKGIAAFVLKYRLVRSMTENPVAELMPKMQDFKKLDEINAPVVEMAVADGKKAIEYVRSHAKELDILPNQIGIMGFSAGGALTLGVGLSYTAANRPDFIAPIYPKTDIFGPIKVPADAPPAWICAASDDQLGFAPHATALYDAWIGEKKNCRITHVSKRRTWFWDEQTKNSYRHVVRAVWGLVKITRVTQKTAAFKLGKTIYGRTNCGVSPR